MKTVDKKEVLSSQSAEFIQQGEEGKFLKLIPDTFVIKMENGKQGYAIRHLNRQDIILIDTTAQGAQQAVKHLVEEGYSIKAILLTHKDSLKNTYSDLKTISEDAGRAPIFAHPMNTNGENINIKSIMDRNNIFEHFSISVQDFPGKSGENVVIYSEINEGMVFAGNAAVGTAYNSEGDAIGLPDLENKTKNESLAEKWNAFDLEFTYFFPYKGKPRFNLSEGEQKDLILKLGRTQ
ncbi:MAG TPA: hypothetical protein VFI78_02980 [Salinimicrobium sp.]|nr:hypothetical protein [Salinimicrobium sp.]